MKRLLAVSMMCVIGVAMVGCEASGRVGDPDNDLEYRKTETVRDSDGDVKTRTEIRREVD